MFPSDYFYDAPYLFRDPGIITVIWVIGIMLLTTAFIKLLLYIFRSIGLYTLSKNRGMSYAALAWIPGIGLYRAGAIADDIALRNGSKTYYRYILLIGFIATYVISFFELTWVFRMAANIFGGYSPLDAYSSLVAISGISSVLGLLPLALYVIRIISLNKIYSCYRPASSTAWTVLSVIFSFLQAFFLFAIRNGAPTVKTVGDNMPVNPYMGQYQPPLEHYAPAQYQQPPQYQPQQEQPQQEQPRQEPDMPPPRDDTDSPDKE